MEQKNCITVQADRGAILANRSSRPKSIAQHTIRYSRILAAKRKMGTTHQTLVERLQEQLDIKNAQTVSQNQEISALKRQVAERDSEISVLRADIAEFDQEECLETLLRTQDELQTAGTANEALQKNVDILSQKLEKAYGQVEELQKRAGELERQLRGQEVASQSMEELWEKRFAEEQKRMEELLASRWQEERRQERRREIRLRILADGMRRN
ncbi:hypothetical protein GGTG_13251 [Gaeumannomyces tritici R3-111a-1]|uniref:Uncharacterized protein n=1 Tax=Gaeumannomyces tritici (strain R3-111a-1) TaxID=644352 RepID=J3PIC3_GAET3|nr:hypothetical protein GGTG_13251 [Gaeumannomyces tritici R3-111a-1]EJT69142.1 hypothetical protein GGTG_13251 [Gaeumannomyces tritici R3-111a-1]